jgi:hypothetical protein
VDGLFPAIKAAGKGDAGKAEVAERASRTTGFRTLEGGKAAIEGRAGEGHDEFPAWRRHDRQPRTNWQGTGMFPPFE